MNLEEKVRSLLVAANEATGEADETLTDAVGSLIVGQGITPSGSLPINVNGTHDVTQYASAEVNVPLPPEAKYTATGRIYTEHVVVPDAVTSLGESVYAISGIQSINLNNVTSISNYSCGRNNTGLASLICPKLTSYNLYLCMNGEDLETIQLGSIGYPVTSISFNKWLGTVSGRSSGGFTVTIYVDATRIDDIPESVRTNAKGGSGAYCNAVIYRNSITGEVLEG